MDSPTLAKFVVYQLDKKTSEFNVQFNPASLTFDKKPLIAEIAIPGLDAPLQQFVRGQAETLSFELFFDSTDKGMGSKVTAVSEKTDQVYGLVKIDPKTHAPPVCEFVWSDDIAGSHLPDFYGSQRRTSFKGLVTSVKQKIEVFGSSGAPLRATLTVEMREYKTLDEQVTQLNLQSADHTRTVLVRRGEPLSLIAERNYGSAADWRLIADANNITDPRRLKAGTLLTLPPKN